MVKCDDQHFYRLMVDGYCYKCRRVYALGTEEEVQKRADQMKEDFAKSGTKL